MPEEELRRKSGVEFEPEESPGSSSNSSSSSSYSSSGAVDALPPAPLPPQAPAGEKREDSSCSDSGSSVESSEEEPAMFSNFLSGANPLSSVSSAVRGSLFGDNAEGDKQKAGTQQPGSGPGPRKAPQQGHMKQDQAPPKQGGPQLQGNGQAGQADKPSGQQASTKGGPKQQAPAKGGPQQEAPDKGGPQQQGPHKGGAQQEGPGKGRLQQAPQQQGPPKAGPQQDSPVVGAQQQAPAKGGPQQQWSPKVGAQQQAPKCGPQQQGSPMFGAQQQAPAKSGPQQQGSHKVGAQHQALTKVGPQQQGSPKVGAQQQAPSKGRPQQQGFPKVGVQPQGFPKKGTQQQGSPRTTPQQQDSSKPGTQSNAGPMAGAKPLCPVCNTTGLNLNTKEPPNHNTCTQCKTVVCSLCGFSPPDSGGKEWLCLTCQMQRALGGSYPPGPPKMKPQPSPNKASTSPAPQNKDTPTPDSPQRKPATSATQPPKTEVAKAADPQKPASSVPAQKTIQENRRTSGLQKPPEQPGQPGLKQSNSTPSTQQEPGKPQRSGASPAKAVPPEAQPTKQESGGFFDFGGPKSQPAPSKPEESVSGKMFGFGSSIFSSASTLITSAVQDEPRFTPPASPKVSASVQASPKMPPAKEIKPAAAQRAEEKKAEQPQQATFPPSVQAKVDKPPSEPPKGAASSQPAPKAGQSTCPLCKVELNKGSKDPPNYNTCTECKNTVCNLCGFNPMPHVTEVKEWLCLNCQTKRMESPGPPMIKPQPSPNNSSAPQRTTVPPSTPQKKGTPTPDSPQRKPATSATQPPKTEVAKAADPQKPASSVPAQKTIQENRRTSGLQKPPEQPGQPGLKQSNASPSTQQEPGKPQQQPPKSGASPAKAVPPEAKPTKKQSGGFSDFGGAKSQPAQSKPEEPVSGKMFGFGSSIFSSASTLITSAVQDEPRFTPPASPKVSAPVQASPKMPPAKEIKPPAAQRADEKKAEQPQQATFPPSVQAKVDKPPSAPPKRAASSQPAPKAGQSTCPLCKVELNKGSKDPPNYNTCTECKNTVCNLCGFNPMPNVSEVKEWLCLNCQMQRALGGMEDPEHPMMIPKPSPNQVSAPAAPRKKDTPTSSGPNKVATAPASPKKEPVTRTSQPVPSKPKDFVSGKMFGFGSSIFSSASTLITSAVQDEPRTTPPASPKVSTTAHASPKLPPAKEIKPPAAQKSEEKKAEQSQQVKVPSSVQAKVDKPPSEPPKGAASSQPASKAGQSTCPLCKVELNKGSKDPPNYNTCTECKNTVCNLCGFNPMTHETEVKEWLCLNCQMQRALGGMEPPGTPMIKHSISKVLTPIAPQKKDTLTPAGVPKVATSPTSLKMEPVTRASQPVPSKPEDSVSGKMFGFGSSIFSSASTLITSDVQDESRTTPPASPKVSAAAQASPKMPPAKETKPPAAQKAEEKKAEQPQQANVPPSVHAKVDKPPSAPPKGAASSQPAPKAGQSTCPLCKVELNKGSKDPPNYNTCTECKNTVCNLCGFNPMPHVTEEWLCLNCQMQRAPGGTEPPGPPITKPSPNKVSAPQTGIVTPSAAQKDIATAAASAKKDSQTPGSPQRKPIPPAAEVSKAETAKAADTQKPASPVPAQKAPLENRRTSEPPKPPQHPSPGRRQSSAFPTTQQPPKQESGGLFGFGGPKSQSTPSKPEESASPKVSAPASPKMPPTKETKPLAVQDAEKKAEQPQQAKVPPSVQAKVDKPQSEPQKGAASSQPAPKAHQSTCPLCKVELNMGSKDPPNYNTCTECKNTVCNVCGFNPMPHVTELNEWLCLNCQMQRALGGMESPGPPMMKPSPSRVSTSAASQKYTVRPVTTRNETPTPAGQQKVAPTPASPRKEPVTSASQPAQSKPEDSVSGKMLGFGSSIFTSASTLITSTVQDEPRTTPPASPKVSMTPASVKETPAAGSSQKKEVSPTVVCQQDQKPVDRPTPTLVQQPPQQKTLQQQGQPPQPSAEAPKSEHDISIVEAATAADTQNPASPVPAQKASLENRRTSEPHKPPQQRSPGRRESSAFPAKKQPPKQESGGLFGFGGPKSQSASSKPEESVSGKMFGFGSSIFSSASTLITSVVQDEARTTPPASPKMSALAHTSPKMPPAKETRLPATQKAEEKKAAHPQKANVPPSVHANVDKPPSAPPKRAASSQPAPKAGQSTCPLCKVELNKGSKDPPNYNTCTECKNTVCNLCGFNPMPHETVKEWLCLTCQMQRALGAVEPPGPPMMKSQPLPSIVSTPVALQKENVTPAASPKPTPAPAKPQKEEIPVPAAGQQEITPPTVPQETPIPAGTPAPNADKKEETPPLGSSQHKQASPALAEKENQEPIIVQKPVDQPIPATPKTSGAATPVQQPEKQTPPLQQPASKASQQVQPQQAPKPDLETAPLKEPMTPASEKEKKNPAPGSPQKELSPAVASQQDKTPVDKSTPTPVQHPPHQETPQQQEQQRQPLTATPKGEPGKPQQQLPKGGASYAKSVPPPQAQPLKQESGGFFGFGGAKSQPAQSKPEDSVSGKMLGFGSSIFSSASTLITSAVQDEHRTTPPASPKVSMTPASVKETPAAGSSQKKEVSPTVVCQQDQKPVDRPTPTLVQQPPQQKTLQQQGQPPQPLAEAPKSEHDISIVEAATAADTQNPANPVPAQKAPLENRRTSEPHKPPQQPSPGRRESSAFPATKQTPKQESGGLFGFGGPKSQSASSKPEESVSGKMFGFGSSIFSSASTLITSVVQDEPRTTPPASPKMSALAQTSPKMPPAKETKLPAAQKAEEKKAAHPQKANVPLSVHAKVDKPPSAPPKGAASSQPAPKAGQSTCPLCKVELNKGSKDPPNYNTCTECKNTVCNLCGFNPMPHETVKEWLCLTCQMQRALGAVEPPGPPMMKSQPLPSIVSTPVALQKENVTPAASPKPTPAPAKPQKEEIPVPAAGQQEITPPTVPQETAIPAGTPAPNADKKEETPPLGSSQHKQASPALAEKENQEPIIVQKPVDQPIPATPKTSGAAIPVQQPEKQTPPLQQPASKASQQVQPQQALKPDLETAPLKEPMTPASEKEKKNPAPGSPQKELSPAVASQQDKTPVDKSTPTPVQHPPHQETPQQQEQQRQPLTATPKGEPGKPQQQLPKGGASYAKSVPPPQAQPFKQESGGFFGFGGAKSQPAQSKPEDSVSGKMLGFGSSIFSSASTLITSAVQDEHRTTPPASPKVSMTPASVKETPAAGSSQKKEVSPTVVCQQDQKPVDRPTPTLVQQPPQQKTLQQQGQPPQPSAEAPKSEPDISIVEAATAADTQNPANPVPAQKAPLENRRTSEPHKPPQQPSPGRRESSAFPATKQTPSRNQEAYLALELCLHFDNISCSGRAPDHTASFPQDVCTGPDLPKMPPAKETKLPAAQKAEEKKAAHPQKANVPPSVHAKVDKPPSAPPKGAASSQPAPKAGQSTCPLCKVELNKGSKDPPNYNTCTECKNTVCNLCGFNPMPHETVKEWLCLTCQMQRALGAVEPQDLP
ncbi:protein bassoon [Oncorhynchus tshawytscha]|uniref:protein bassoon n=1 Tax=Oncorhynchus tshawytscha TaxID=74940 RepID=UPI001C3D6915|nr:protein bassoon [Oncorhynchus tshawytscha]